MAICRVSEARHEVKSPSRGEDAQDGAGAVFTSVTGRDNVTPRSANLKIARRGRIIVSRGIRGMERGILACKQCSSR